jgi:hypothetical protein
MSVEAHAITLPNHGRCDQDGNEQDGKWIAL